ncbi:MAG: NlpC/P60 family protein [Leucobacter sp.]
MNQTPGNEVVAVSSAPVSAPSKYKRLAKTFGAAALSAGLVGTFALPAYASTNDVITHEAMGSVSESQSVETAVVDPELANANLEAALAIAETSNDPEMIADIEREKEALEAAQQQTDEPQSEEAAVDFSGSDIPAGSGAQGIIAAAEAQFGVRQDCTALVEKALRAVGIPAGDLGTQVGEYTALGGQAYGWGSQAAAPGDILVWPGQHVSVYIGNGQHIDAGFSYGNGTGVRGATAWGNAPAFGVRF